MAELNEKSPNKKELCLAESTMTSIQITSFEKNITKPSSDVSKRKSILISYVRSEAEQHARQLKRELIDLGCNVFLDLDEIKAGDDWQNVLNNAILNCDLFVPLVTPRYGYTKWTEREVKLADIKDKKIIPISFLESWPPQCLAIQFATIQYIPWKKLTEIESIGDEEGEHLRDILYWDKPYVKMTAIDIFSRYQELEKQNLGCLSAHSQSLNQSFGSLSSSGLKKRKRIVISAHPELKEILSIISKNLRKHGFDVWSDLTIEINDILEEYEDIEKTYDFSLDRLYKISASDSAQSIQISGIDQTSEKLILDVKFQSEKSSCHSEPYILDSKNFRNQADAADVVIILLSKSYCDSRTCKEQAFYCGFRKKVIAIKYDDLHWKPHWLSKLIENANVMEHKSDNIKSFFVKLNKKVSKLTSSSNNSFECTKSEKRIYSLASSLRRKSPFKEEENTLVFITGGNIYNPVYRAIVRLLASIPSLVLVSDSIEVSETTGKTFCEERKQLIEENPAIYHILPHNSLQMHRFEDIPFSQTLSIGDSFEERDTVIAPMFKCCISMEYGHRSSWIVEEFMWNDIIIIPILCIQSDKMDFLGEFHNAPFGVDKNDWSILFRNDATIEEIAQSVKNIICSLMICH